MGGMERSGAGDEIVDTDGIMHAIADMPQSFFDEPALREGVETVLARSLPLDSDDAVAREELSRAVDIIFNKVVGFVDFLCQDFSRLVNWGQINRFKVRDLEELKSRLAEAVEKIRIPDDQPAYVKPLAVSILVEFVVRTEFVDLVPVEEKAPPSAAVQNARISKLRALMFVMVLSVLGVTDMRLSSKHAEEIDATDGDVGEVDAGEVDAPPVDQLRLGFDPTELADLMKVGFEVGQILSGKVGVSEFDPNDRRLGLYLRVVQRHKKNKYSPYNPAARDLAFAFARLGSAAETDHWAFMYEILKSRKDFSYDDSLTLENEVKFFRDWLAVIEGNAAESANHYGVVEIQTQVAFPGADVLYPSQSLLAAALGPEFYFANIAAPKSYAADMGVTERDDGHWAADTEKMVLLVRSFSEKWGLDPSYDDQIQKLFRMQIYDGNEDAAKERVFVIRTILEASGVSWPKFLAEILPAGGGNLYFSWLRIDD